MGDARANLIQSTINNAVAASNDNYQFSVESQDTTDPSTWIIYGQIKTRAGSPVYDGGYIMIRIELPLGYPFDPPLVYSLHKIFHPNVDEYGKNMSNKIILIFRFLCFKVKFVVISYRAMIYGLRMTPSLNLLNI